ncbi:DNA mismatch repair protein MutL [Saliniradius amylolyticus]|uniref:DNA mismatch repair protein MutL n=1 Tax=Saliniradius amylolyticus TaxID=2183582 RepID=A0A2S2E6K6_9ALTE|nr:DNA mismatch repair endonuclease MutL [Saliniradius amylolyticus]AWL13273.1 DNA mismatch repair protein MutL [Saliniradius amylolyticus]
MSIQILPPILANQIAAGEVVERPSSVVKELVENSLDAGADRIEIDIDKGGHKRILVRDNGKGIAKSELELALSRHATSKIHCLDDLEQIASLGFRGEALASISSVARLTISSKPQSQEAAWQAFAEGAELAVKVQPVAHPDGTSVDIQDLFFNTPARRKFLRTEKTEFSHIDELIRRIALSQFEVGFTLKHNGKRVRHYPAAKNAAAREKRIARVCGESFMQQALTLDSQYDGLRLHGWLSLERRHQPEHQFVYVNGRMMRDKLINHAIRQVFNEVHPGEDYPGFVLYLELDPKQVDVNVHPAKHEVRFHQARLVHDFIYRALADVLNQTLTTGSESLQRPQQAASVSELPRVEPEHNYIRPLQPRVAEASGRYASQSRPPSSGASQNYQRLMTVEKHPHEVTMSHWMPLDSKHILLRQDEQLWLIPTQTLDSHYLQQQLQQQPVSQPLLMPISVVLKENLAMDFETRLETLGIHIQRLPGRVLIKQVPAGLRQLDWASTLTTLMDNPWDGEVATLSDIIARQRAPLDDGQLEHLVRCWTQSEQEPASLSGARRLSVESLINE